MTTQEKKPLTRTQKIMYGICGGAVYCAFAYSYPLLWLGLIPAALIAYYTYKGKVTW